MANRQQGAEKDLEDVGYDTIPPIPIIQCVSAHLCKQVRRKDILKLDKKKFISSWDTVKDGIFSSVDFLRKFLHVPVSRLLPYNAIPCTIYVLFYQNEREKTIEFTEKTP